ncbi:MAG TPA: methyltransferase domain-containing protein [Actinophytocola sp.]|uniref:class I SAM-dependent methyltransferase n=1 Tax=Actinophytocola sp. TaxID=1872138 RepID=UPI002DDD0BAC|nr:methyltransferase domain-containing protein [Actinophytocola sp.]HEV2784431.1 methyltransferase domain-containing protein [Actinophytocola sp.]
MASALIQGSLWDRRARDWTCLQEARHRPLRRALLGALAPLSGVRLLDVGCGVGLLLREAADRGAWIAGVDAAAELLEVARWALPDADLRVGMPEALPYDNGRFDVVTACHALRYADDQPAALAELVRVVRPGGRVAIGQWADPDGCLTRDFLDRIGPAVAGPDLSARGALEAHLHDAGMIRIDGSELDFPFTYPDLATAWSAMVARGCVGDALDIAGKDAVYEVFLDVFAPAVRADGSIHDENVFRYIVAGKPV